MTEVGYTTWISGLTPRQDWAGLSVTQRRPSLKTLELPALAGVLERWFEQIAPCPWSAHVGLHASGWPAVRSEALQASTSVLMGTPKTRARLYTPDERVRRDATKWTTVQAVLAPLQFLVFAASLILILRYFATGEGYRAATVSILIKTVALYAIMITGSIWEKEVFGKWLFARPFFWEDVFSMLVLGLQTTYVVALLRGWGTPAQQMMIAVSAYAAYAINATQFLLKLRAARLEAAPARRSFATA